MRMGTGRRMVRGGWVLVWTGVCLMALAGIGGGPVGRTVYAGGPDRKELGASLFHEKGCEHCHGVDGHGGDLGPDLRGVGKRKNKEQIEHQIREGGGAMPAFGDALEPEEIENLVAYLHAKTT